MLEWQCENWEETFTNVGAVFRHDLNFLRPFPRTKRGISDFFFNADIVGEDPTLLSRAVGHLVRHPDFLEAIRQTPGAVKKVPREQPPTTMSPYRPTYIEDGWRLSARVVGAAYGGITFSHEIARHFGCKLAFTAKRQDGIVAIRSAFAKRIAENEIIILADDTATSGGTIRDLRDEIFRVAPKARVMPAVLTLCNRSGETEVGGMKIVSLFSPKCRVWQNGCNPFITGGVELVPPVYPPKDYWDELTRAYPSTHAGAP